MPGFTTGDVIGIIGIFVMIIAPCILHLKSLDAEKEKNKMELKKVAKTIYLDIQNIENSSSFRGCYGLYKQVNSACSNNGIEIDKLQPPYVPREQFYNKETGIYFLYKNDITKFDYSLSSNIVKFYNNLIIAENNRLLLFQNPNISSHNYHTRNPEDIEITRKYCETASLIVECGNMIQKLKDDLIKVQNNS